MLGGWYNLNQVLCAHKNELRAIFGNQQEIGYWVTTNLLNASGVGFGHRASVCNSRMRTHTFTLPSEDQFFWESFEASNWFILIESQTIMASSRSIEFHKTFHFQRTVIEYGRLGLDGCGRILVFKHPGRYSRALTAHYNSIIHYSG